MSIVVSDLQVTPTHVPPLRWSSAWDLAHIGPAGQALYQQAPWANTVVFTFEIHRPAQFAFQCALDTDDESLNLHDLREFVKVVIYVD